VLRYRRALNAVALLVTGLQMARGQEKPLTVDAKFSSGYYNTYTRGDTNQSINFVPVGATFDINGYYMMPDLLNFWIQPELNYGPQASDVGFQGGNGVRMRVNVLRQRAFPLTFRYSNIQLEDVFYGSLSQVSAYTLKERTTDLGLTWELRPPGFPATTFDWGTGSVDSKSGIPQVPDYLSRVSHYNVDSKYQPKGWELNAFAHRQDQSSDILALQGDSSASSSTVTQNVTQVQASARRGFFTDSEFYTSGGTQSTSTVLLDLPFNLSTRYINTSLRMFQRRRWKASVRAGYTTNLASLLLNQIVSTLGSGPGAIAPTAAALSPVQSNLANLTMNATTSVDLTHGLGLFGNLDRGSIINNSNQPGPSASYITSTAGVSYAGKLRWGNVSAQYGRDLGQGSITGQSGTIQGQNYQFSAQRGTVDGLQLNGSVHGSDQSIQNAQPISEHSFSVEGGVARRVTGVWVARVGGGWQNGSFKSSTSEFQNGGYTARLGIEHPRFQFNGSLSSNLGNSLPIYSALAGQLALGAVLLGPVQTIPSDFRAMTLNVHANPLRKVEVSALWTRSLQHLDGVLANDFGLLDIRITYHFRKIQVEAGYLTSSQIFSSYLATYPQVDRGRMYVRITRQAHLL